MNVLFSEASPVAMQNVSWKYYILFIVLNAVDFLVIAFLFPETKGGRAITLGYFNVLIGALGRTLEDMAKVFGDEIDVGTTLGREKRASDSPTEEKENVA